MRLKIVALVLAAGASQAAWAHGPQIQTTLTNGKIVTRRVVPDGAYDTVLTPATTAYVMPLAQYQGVWRAQPDGSLLPDSTPEFVGWPGFAYGYGYDAVSNPAPFPVGSKFTLGFTGGLKSWDGAAFVDAGVTEAEIYRGSSAAPSALAKTMDAGPFAGVQFPGGAGISFASELGEVHNTVHYRMVGDGNSITSPLADGVYLLSMKLSSSDAGVAESAPFYFVLSKGAADATVLAAAESLGAGAGQTQYVPEPASAGLAFCGLAAMLRAARRGRG